MSESPRPSAHAATEGRSAAEALWGSEHAAKRWVSPAQTHAWRVEIAVRIRELGHRLLETVGSSPGGDEGDDVEVVAVSGPVGTGTVGLGVHRLAMRVGGCRGRGIPTHLPCRITWKSGMVP